MNEVRSSNQPAEKSPPARPAAPRSSLWRRLWDALMTPCDRQVQREVDNLVTHRDGTFNDALEREIAERFYAGATKFRP